MCDPKLPERAFIENARTKFSPRFRFAVVAIWSVVQAIGMIIVPRRLSRPNTNYSKKVRQHINDEGALPVIPNRSTAIKKAYCPKHFYWRRHKTRTSFAASKIGGASPPTTTSSPATSLLPQRWSACSTGSNCESKPQYRSLCL